VTSAGTGRGLDRARGAERPSDRRRAVRHAAPAGGPNRLMSVDELAAYLGVPKNTVYGCWRQWGLRGRRRMGHSATDRPGPSSQPARPEPGSRTALRDHLRCAKGRWFLVLVVLGRAHRPGPGHHRRHHRACAARPARTPLASTGTTVTWPGQPSPSMIERARDELARRAEAQHPGWSLSPASTAGPASAPATASSDGLPRCPACAPLWPMPTA